MIAAVRTLYPGFESTLSITIKITPQGRVFYCGGARNLLPLAYERPAPNTRTKGLKTGKNREFLQKTVFLGNFYTTHDRTHPQNFGIFTLFHTKIPYKNNREFFVTYQGIINEYQGTLFQAPATRNEPKYTNIPHFDIAVCL